MGDKHLTFLLTLIGAMALLAASLFMAQKNLNLNLGFNLSFNKPQDIVLEQVKTYPLKLRLSSKAFENEGKIPELYTCKGNDFNPPLSISNFPTGTKSLTLIVEDPDAPFRTWTHWIVFNIDPRYTEILENTPPRNSVLGESDFGVDDYRGPCPPLGKHRYFFKLFALDTILNVEKGASRKEIEIAMENHILDTAELVGIFER